MDEDFLPRVVSWVVRAVGCFVVASITLWFVLVGLAAAFGIRYLIGV